MNKLELMNHIVTSTAVLIILTNMVQAPPNYHKQLKSVSQEYNDGEDFEHSSGDDAEETDDEYIDGSADSSPTSLCQRQELEASARNQSPDNMYIPKCTSTGMFEPKQCSTMKKDNKKIVQCWCVNESGHELPGTRLLAPRTPNCSAVNGASVAVSRYSSTMSPVYIAGGKEGGHDGGGKRPPNKNKDSGRVTTKISISPVSNELTEEELKHERMSNEGKAVPVTSLRQIGLIAGVIGGAFIGLVLAVLLVLFIVYRMRKKDEGSYALEEPKGSPMIGYTKTSDREFFA